MHRHLFNIVFASFASAGFPLTGNAQTVSLHTAQTVVRLEAGAAAPQLLSLQAPGKVLWTNHAAEDLIANVEVDGHSVPLRWKLVAKEGHSDAKHISFVYETQAPHLRLTWEWSARAATGPLEHCIRIENLDNRELWLPLQASLRYSWTVPPTQSLKQIYVDKGAGKPSSIGTHELELSPGYQWEGRSSTYATDQDPREIIPWFMVERDGEQGDGWYVGLEFSARTSLTLERAGGFLQGSVGLNPNPGPFRTRLLPGASFETPPVFLGAFTGGQDGLGNVLRPWVREVLTYPGTWKKQDYPLLVNNSWGSGMAVDETLAKRMIDDSQSSAWRCWSGRWLVPRRRRLVSESEKISPWPGFHR